MTVTEKWETTGLLKDMTQKEKDECAQLLENCGKWMRGCDPASRMILSRLLPAVRRIYGEMRLAQKGMQEWREKTGKVNKHDDSMSIDFKELLDIINEQMEIFRPLPAVNALDNEVEVVVSATEIYMKRHKENGNVI